MFPPLLKRLYLLLPHLAYQQQNIQYPCTKYYFDENQFFGINAKDLLIQMIKSPNCIDGCKLVSMRPKQIKTQFRKGTWTLVCSHGIVMNEMDESHYYPDSVGKFNVPIQNLKLSSTRSPHVSVNGPSMGLYLIARKTLLPLALTICEFILLMKHVNS